MDSCDTDGSSEACAEAIRFALSQMFGEEYISNMLAGQATDSGGGGAGNSFYKELTKLNLTSSVKAYLKSFCTLYCIQLTLSNPIYKNIGRWRQG
jgi:hypothetical protein